ncbi:unnamed protein product [Sphagnum balticum]
MKEEEREEEEGATKLLDHRFLDPDLLPPCGPTTVQSLHHQLDYSDKEDEVMEEEDENEEEEDVVKEEEVNLREGGEQEMQQEKCHQS